MEPSDSKTKHFYESSKTENEKKNAFSTSK